MSESVVRKPDVRGFPPQIPVFPPLKLREPREETKVGGERDGTNNVTRSLVGSGGGGGGIMNTPDISTIRARAVSCKKTIGREGPGRNKNVRALTAGNSYIPDTSPPRKEKSSHTNSCSNTVKVFPRTHQHTPPSRPIGGTPLLAGTSSIASPVKVLVTREFGSRSRDSRRRNSFPRTPSVARGASAPREPSVGLYNKAVAKFCKDSDEGLAQSIPEGQAKRS